MMLSEATIVEVVLGLITALLVVVWWLLRQKDEAQQREIAWVKEKHEKDVKDLWDKHDEDVKRLQMLELDIARSHYVKGELDVRFDKLEASIREGMGDLGKKFDHVAELLMARGA